MKRTILVVLLAALALAGCGGPDPGTLPACDTGRTTALVEVPRNGPYYAQCCRLPDGGTWPSDC
jgi:hypothetical protein